jgi:hypothetical protein
MQKTIHWQCCAPGARSSHFDRWETQRQLRSRVSASRGLHLRRRVQQLQQLQEQTAALLTWRG